MKKWYIRYRDHEGKLKTIPGFTDKTATQQLGAKLEREAEMVRAGFLEPTVVFQNVTLDQHLASFEASLAAKDVTKAQVKLVVNRCRNLLTKAKIVRASDRVAGRSALAEAPGGSAHASADMPTVHSGRVAGVKWSSKGAEVGSSWPDNLPPDCAASSGNDNLQQTLFGCLSVLRHPLRGAMG